MWAFKINHNSDFSNILVVRVRPLKHTVCLGRNLEIFQKCFKIKKKKKNQFF